MVALAINVIPCVRSLSFLLLCAMSLTFVVGSYARDKTDVIEMKNGDRITCEIKGLDHDVLYVGLDYVDGTVAVNWAKISRIQTKQLFIVRTAAGATYTGAISQSPPTQGAAPARFAITAAGNTIEINPSEVLQMSETSGNVWRRFNGELHTGIVFSKANVATQYNIGTAIDYPTERWSMETSVNSSLAANQGSDTTTRNQFDLAVLRRLQSNNWYYAGFTDLLQSSEQSIDLQSTFGLGAGYYLLNSSRLSLSVLGGLAWQNTKYKPASVETPQDLLAGVIASELKFFKFSRTSLRLNGALFPALSEQHRARLNVNGSYYVKIVGNLSWNLSFYGSWDTAPPATFSGNDYGSSSGISWTFGNR